MSNAIFYALALIYLVPPFVSVFFGASSLAPGVLLSAVVVSLLALAKGAFFSLSSVLKLLALIFIVFANIVFCFFVSSSFEIKVFSSFLAVQVIFISSMMLGGWLSKLDGAVVDSSVKCIFALLAVLGLLSLVYKPNFMGYEVFSKSVFPFSEPSHFIMAIAPFALYFSVVTNKLAGGGCLSVLGVLAVLQPSFLALLLVLIILSIYVFSSYRIMVACFGGGVVLAIFFIDDFLSSPASQYYLDRVTVSEDVTNTSLLVILQGFEDAISTLNETVFGYGFQSENIIPPGVYGERLHEVSGRYINKENSFLAAKIVVDFGYIGLLFLFFYIGSFFKAVLYIVNYLKRKSVDPGLDCTRVFSCCVIVGFSLELFFRGYGYFSPGLLLYLAACFYQLRRVCDA